MASSPRKSAEGQTQPSQKKFFKKSIAKTGGPVYLPCRRLPSFQMPKNMIFFQNPPFFSYRHSLRPLILSYSFLMIYAKTRVLKYVYTEPQICLLTVQV